MVVLPTPACLPCVHGCNSDGVCNDEPYTEDGLPIVSYEYDECSLHEVGGTCDDGAYEWTCAVAQGHQARGRMERRVPRHAVGVARCGLTEHEEKAIVVIPNLTTRHNTALHNTAQHNTSLSL